MDKFANSGPKSYVRKVCRTRAQMRHAHVVLFPPRGHVNLKRGHDPAGPGQLLDVERCNQREDQ